MPRVQGHTAGQSPNTLTDRHPELASPPKDELFKILDLIFAQDPRFRMFLAGRMRD